MVKNVIKCNGKLRDTPAIYDKIDWKSKRDQIQ